MWLDQHIGGSSGLRLTATSGLERYASSRLSEATTSLSAEPFTEEGEHMSPNSRPALHVNSKLLSSGAILLCVGGVVLMAGAALAATALAQAASDWIKQLEESPTEMAQRRFQQFKVAAEAGTKAWRDQTD